MPPGYASAYDVRVRCAETDAQGIAHHASFVVWLEVARVAYRAAPVFDDVLTVGLRCVDVRGARFRYENVVERDGELVATAETSHATVASVTRLPTRVPAWFADAVATAGQAG